MAWEVGMISFLVMLLGTVIAVVNSVSFRCQRATRTSHFSLLSLSVCVDSHCVGDHFLVPRDRARKPRLEKKVQRSGHVAGTQCGDACGRKLCWTT